MAKPTIQNLAVSASFAETHAEGLIAHQIC